MLCEDTQHLRHRGEDRPPLSYPNRTLDSHTDQKNYRYDLDWWHETRSCQTDGSVALSFTAHRGSLTSASRAYSSDPAHRR
jgi:hypothetical protein